MRTKLILMLGLVLTGCGQPAAPPSARSEAEQRTHDSIVGESRLPGATGVNGALRASDSAAARRAREAAIQDS
jgi:hypothetical protein